MNQEEACFEHPQDNRRHHQHDPYQTHYYRAPSVQLQQHDLHSEFLYTHYSFGYEYSPGSSSSSTSTETVRDISSPGQMTRHSPFCVSDEISRPKRRKCHTQPAQQRHAASIRERGRMQSISHAFEGLRAYIPKMPYEKHLTKVDTLRLAIKYIAFLSGVLQSDIHGKESSHVQAERKKVIIRCPNSTGEDFVAPGSPLPAGLSLSWLDTKHASLEIRKKTLAAKVWIPEDPRTNTT